jgi:hypothetical protein
MCMRFRAAVVYTPAGNRITALQYTIPPFIGRVTKINRLTHTKRHSEAVVNNAIAFPGESTLVDSENAYCTQKCWQYRQQ